MDQHRESLLNSSPMTAHAQSARWSTRCKVKRRRACRRHPEFASLCNRSARSLAAPQVGASVPPPSRAHSGVALPRRLTATTAPNTPVVHPNEPQLASLLSVPTGHAAVAQRGACRNNYCQPQARSPAALLPCASAMLSALAARLARTSPASPPRWRRVLAACWLRTAAVMRLQACSARVCCRA